MIRLLLFVLLLVPVLAGAQSVLPLRADTVRVEKVGSNGELQVKNATRTVRGPLSNVGNGVTRFMQTRKSGDTLFVGGDTILNIGGSGGPDSTFYKLSWTDVATFGAKPDGKEDSTGNISASSATFTSSTATFTVADVGKYIAVGGAGASGAELITTIAGFTNSTTITLTATAGTTVTNAKYKYGTNNTTAIQNAINSLTDSSAGTLYFHPGRYFVTSAPVTDVDGYNPNSILYIPHSAYAPSASQKSIRLLGSTPPNLFIDFASGQVAPNAGTVIEALRNDSAAALLGTVADTAVYGIFNWRMCYLENLTFRTKSDNQVTDVKALLSGINFSRQNFAVANNVRVQTTSATESSIKPDSLSYGIWFPIVNNGGNNHLNNVLVQGYGAGFKLSENTNGDNLTISACNIALQIDSSLHGLNFGRILTTWCPTKLKVTGTSYFHIQQYDIEHYSIGSYWFNDVVDLDETLAYNSIGDLNYFIQLAFGGQSISQFTRTGNYITSGIKATPIGGVVSHNFVNTTNQEVRIGSMKGADGTFMLITDGTGTTSNNFAFGGIKQRSTGIGLAGTGVNDWFSYNAITGRVNHLIDVNDNQYFGGAQAHLTPQLTLQRADSSAVFAGQVTANAGSMIFARQSVTFPTFYYGNLAGGTNQKWNDWYTDGITTAHRFLDDSKATPVEFFKAVRGGDTYLANGNVSTTGNLAVGSTVTTDARLKVQENINAANVTLLRNTDAGSGASTMMQFQNNAGIVYMYLSSSTSALSNDFLIQQTIGNTRMYTAAGEVARFTSGGEVQVGSTTDFGAFKLQNTGGLYQNGTVSLNGQTGPPAGYTVLVKGIDSTVYQVPSTTFGNGIYGGSGSLPSNVAVTGAGNTLTLTGTQSSLSAFNVTNTGNGGAGSFSTDGTGSALTGANSSSGNGVLATSSSGNGLSATSVSSIAGRFKITPTSTTTIVHPVRIIRGSSNTMAAGGGGGIDMQLTDAGGNDATAVSLAPVFTTATAGATTADLQINTVNAGSSTLKFTLKGNGQQRLHNYGVSTFTGTATTSAQFDVNGNIIEGPAVTSGTYTPTLTNTTNVAASTAYQFQWSRVGNTVTFSGEVDIDPTAGLTLTVLTMTLPVVPGFANSFECAGTAADDLGTVARVRATASAGTAEVRMTPTDASNRRFSVHGTYLFIAP